MELAEKKCKPCSGTTPPLTREQAEALANQVPDWTVEERAIVREITFKGFSQAMAFVNQVAHLAQGEGHHPSICIYYNRVRLENTTHAIGGLSENDFILAAKIDGLG